MPHLTIMFLSASGYIQPLDMEDDIRTETDSEEEADELMMLIIPALVASTKTPCHTSKLSGAEYTSELLEGHKCRSYHNLRMEPRIFKALSDYLSSRNFCGPQEGSL
jgi:hypothetical protein